MHNIHARSLNYRRTSSSEEPPKNKYIIVTIQTMNVLSTIFVLFLCWSTNPIEEISTFYWIVRDALVAILVVFIVIKLFIWRKDYANPGGSSSKDRCKRDLLIGYGAISFFGYIPLIVMYIYGYHPFLVMSAFICYIPPGLIIPLFILQHLKKYQVCREKHSTNLRAICFALHAIVFIAIAFFVGRLKEFAPYFIMYDTLMFANVRAEFLVVLVNGVWLKERLERLNVAELGVQEPLIRSSSGSDPDTSSRDSISENSVRTEVNHEPRSNATECQICLLQYSNSVIPRILIGCGHTICEKCVGKLPRQGDHLNRVLCPFCRNGTRLPGGGLEQLPKNFTVLDIVMEQRNQGQTVESTRE